MTDYRKFPDLNFYVAEISDRTMANDCQCPACHSWFQEPQIDTCEMYEGDSDYWICPHCGALLKFEMYLAAFFNVETCTADEFEKETGENLKKYAAQKDKGGSKNE